MRNPRFPFAWLVTLAAGFVVGCAEPSVNSRDQLSGALNGAETGAPTGGTSVATGTSGPVDTRFAVPNGSAEELLSFIERLAKPTEQFKSNEEAAAYRQQAARSIGEAADRILAGETTGVQASDAVGWKLESLRVLGALGDPEAEANTEKFLESMGRDARPAVRSTAARMKLLRTINASDKLDEAGRLAALQGYAAHLQANGLVLADAQLLLELSSLVFSNLFPTSDAAAAPYRELLPLFRQSSDPEIAKLADTMEATVRRLELPGKKLELEGEFLDGNKLDWESYRGKVVLVDFWASTCGECFLELPNVLTFYQKYRDQGFEVVGVNLDNDRAQAKRIVEEWGLEWPSLFNENPEAEHWDHPMAKKYAINALPRMILVDKQGIVVHMDVRGAVLGQELKKLLGESTAQDAGEAQLVPDGSAAEILDFVKRHLQSIPPPQTADAQQRTMARMRTVFDQAAEKILAGDPTGDQAEEAFEMKMMALGADNPRNINANEDLEKFLARHEASPSPAIAGNVARIRMAQHFSKWRALSTAERAAAVDQFVAAVARTGPSVGHARTLAQLVNMTSAQGGKDLALAAIDKLLPLYRKSDDPDVAKGTARLEGVVRRVNLPGNKLELEGTLMDGSQLDWDAYRGKVVLVDYWASWCGPCLAEVPNIRRAYAAYKDKGFEVLGICLDDERAAAEACIEGAGISWPSLFSDDPEANGPNHPMATRYAVSTIPQAFLVDREGKVVSMAARGPMLEMQLGQLLGEPGPSAHTEQPQVRLRLSEPSGRVDN